MSYTQGHVIPVFAFEQFVHPDVQNSSIQTVHSVFVLELIFKLIIFLILLELKKGIIVTEKN